MNDDAPSSIRIRTDPDAGLKHRYESIRSAKQVLGAGSNTAAVVHSCEIVSGLGDVLPEVLEELPPEQAERVARRLSKRGLVVEYEGPRAEVRTE